MDLQLNDMPHIIAITIICGAIGMVVKNIPTLDNRWIPPIMAIVGGLLGVVALYSMASFPTQDMLTAISIGIVSGLASTGAHQFGKQLGAGK